MNNPWISQELDITWTIMKKSLKIVNKLWTNNQKSLTSHEEVTNWTCHEQLWQIHYIFWISCVKAIKKSWTNCEHVINKSWRIKKRHKQDSMNKLRPLIYNSWTLAIPVYDMFTFCAWIFILFYDLKSGTIAICEQGLDMTLKKVVNKSWANKKS